MELSLLTTFIIVLLAIYILGKIFSKPNVKKTKWEQMGNISSTEKIKYFDNSKIEKIKQEYYSSIEKYSDDKLNRKALIEEHNKITQRLPYYLTLIEKKQLRLLQYWEFNPIKVDIINDYLSYRSNYFKTIIDKEPKKLNVNDALWSYMNKLSLELAKKGYSTSTMESYQFDFKREEKKVKQHLKNKKDFIQLLTKGSINLLEKNNIVHYADFTKLNRADVRLMFGRGNIDRNQSQVEVIDTILLMKNLWYSDDTFHNIITSCQIVAKN